jgi:hypothetical protein
MVHDGTYLSCLLHFRSLSPRRVEVEGNIKLGIASPDLSPTHNTGVDTYDMRTSPHRGNGVNDVPRKVPEIRTNFN